MLAKRPQLHDSKCAITRASSQGLRRRSYTTPNVTLRAEWDIESVILETYKELAINFVFLHIKSHQDDDSVVSSLLLASQLNVEADRLTTDFLQENEPRKPIALLFPMQEVLTYTSTSCNITNGKSEPWAISTGMHTGPAMQLIDHTKVTLSSSAIITSQ